LTVTVATTTGLSMLWESIDHAIALTDRFGFTDAEHAGAWLAETLRIDWDRRLQCCDRLVISASNLLAWLTVDDEFIIAKCSVDRARFSQLAQSDAVVAWLDSECVPVASPVAARDGRLRVERERFSLGLYPVVEGDLLDVGDAEQVAAAGRVLATLHNALAVYPLSFGDGGNRADQQLVHGDFRSANVLQVNGRITAIVDFDEVTYQSKIQDLAKAVVLLGTRYHDWAPTSLQTREEFVRAYGDVAPLTDRQCDELYRAITKVLSHFGWT